MSEDIIHIDNDTETIQATTSSSPIAPLSASSGNEGTIENEQIAGSSSVVGDPKLVGLSKNAQKRILKAQRMEELKKVKRQAEKERKKQKREEAKKQGIYLPSKNRSKLRPKKQFPVNAKVVIDLGFDELMTDKETSSICSQLNLCYSANRMSTHPFKSLVFSGQGSVAPLELLSTDDPLNRQNHAEVNLFDSRVGERMQTKLVGVWQRWQDVHLRNTGGLEGLYEESSSSSSNADQQPICSKEQIVYLTADTENTLESIKEGEVYVIGGLVDRNRYKNICAEKAKRLGIRTAKLPINAERLKSSMVMTVNQVMNILLEFNKTQDWEQAFDQHLPQRKMKKEEGNAEERTDELEQQINEKDNIQ